MELAYEASGCTDGTAVVLIHPLGADRRFWRGCYRHLGTGILAIALDLPGTELVPATEPVTLRAAIDYIEGIRRYLGYDQIVLAGCAVGAMAAMGFAALFPKHTRGLIACNPGLAIVDRASANLIARAKLVRSKGMNALLPDAVDNAFDGCCGTKLHENYTRRFAAQNPEQYALSALGAASADTAEWLSLIECPTLVVGGGHDKLFPVVAHAAKIAARISRSNFVQIPQGAHFIPYQRPSEFSTLVRNFLTTLAIR